MAKPKSVNRRKGMLSKADVFDAPGLKWRLEQTHDNTYAEKITAIVAWMWRTELINDVDELKALGYELEYGPAGETIKLIEG